MYTQAGHSFQVVLAEMTKVNKYIVILLGVLVAISSATAQDIKMPNLDTPIACALEKQTSAENYDTSLQNVYIRYQHDKAWPRWDYAENLEARKALMEVVKELATDKQTKRSIIIEGAASPIGGEEYNRDLALRRARVLKQILSKMEGGDKISIYTISSGEDWITFAQHIEHSYHRANRKEVLDILLSDASNNDKEQRLHALDNGKTWRLLVTKFMAPARNAAVVRIVEHEPLMTYLRAPQFKGEVAPCELIPPFGFSREESALIAPQPIVTEITPRKPVFAFRSNLLVPALNVGVEVPIGNHWSIGADYYYPWVWPKRDNKNCFEMLAWGIEARYWFGRNRTEFDRLQGHSLGLYGYMGYYDFEYNFHGHQGEFANVGIDYTYAMAVGKKKSVFFEFSLGIGFIYSQARKYTVIESGAPLISDKITKTISFFGPTKANISLVVPIFQKVKPNKQSHGDE